MDDQNKNLILATVLSFLVILGWFVAGPMLFPQWFPETQLETTAPVVTDATVPAADSTAPAATVASTEPLPERITLPPGAELPVPCEWYANTRLIDPASYVGSECPDFPELAAGDWRSVFRIGGRTVEVDIKVK